MAAPVPSSSLQPTAECLPPPNVAKDSSSPDPECAPAAATASLDCTSNTATSKIAPSASNDIVSSSAMPLSLSATEVQEIITNRIQQCVNGCSASFSCGSSTVLTCTPMVSLLGDDGEAVGEPILLHRPPLGGNNRKDIFKTQESQLEHLMSMMPRASFGKGGETVIDISVRDALQLDATKFALNIPQETIDHILANVKVNLDLQTDVVAEQYSLNVYRTGGMFKKHKDTPRGDDMLGTLVICFPTLYEGGCMRVTHGREVNQYFQRYSLPHCSHGSVEAVDNRVEWCAFFSDVDHEILTVREGIRVTAAYILRRKDNAPASECIPRPLRGQEQADRIRDSFLLGLRDDRFLSNGGKIGCACLHQYTNQQVFPGDKDSLQALDAGQIRKLKGNDLLIANAAVSAGLSVRLVPHLGHDYSCDGEGDFPLKKFPNKKKCPKRMSDDSIVDFFDATQGAGQLQNEVDIWILDMNVAASTSAGCTEWNAEGYFGNEASDIAFYVNACLIIEIPSYSGSRGVSRPAPIEVDAQPKAKAKKRNSEDSEGSKDQSSKKKKKAKDPNAPKRNLSAWMHYSISTRADVKASQPDLTFGEITKAASAKWKALSEQERAVWEEKAAADKERYEKELARYKDSELALKWQASQVEESNQVTRSDSSDVTTCENKQANDLNPPKKNLTAYMHYSNYARAHIKANHPQTDSKEITKVVQRGWNAMTVEQRHYWDEKAAADRERYQKELAKYQRFEATVQDIVEADMSAQEALDELLMGEN